MSLPKGESVDIFNQHRLSSQELEELKTTCRGLSDTNPKVKEQLLKILEEKHETHINSEDDIKVYCGVQTKLASLHHEMGLDFNDRVNYCLLTDPNKRVEVLQLLYLRGMVKPG